MADRVGTVIHEWESWRILIVTEQDGTFVESLTQRLCGHYRGKQWRTIKHISPEFVASIGKELYEIGALVQYLHTLKEKQ